MALATCAAGDADCPVHANLAIVVILRCISRFVLIRNAKLDDYLIIAALVSPSLTRIDPSGGRR